MSLSIPCMCVWFCVSVYVCIYTCMYFYVCMWICLYVIYLSLCFYLCMSLYMYMCIRASLCIYMYVFVHVPLCVRVYLCLCVQVCYRSLMPWNMGLFHLVQYQTIILSSERLWGWPKFSLAEAAPCAEVSPALQTPWQEGGPAVPSWREPSALYRIGSASRWPHADPDKGLCLRLCAYIACFGYHGQLAPLYFGPR